MSSWNRHSWQEKSIKQMPTYKNQDILNDVCHTIENFPPLVFAGETRYLKERLGEAALGKSFLLQGGDCAETFEDLKVNDVRDTLRVIMQMAIIMMYGTGLPVIKVGRIAGQFAKPRSENMEMVDGKEMPSYRGDMINDFAPDLSKREHDPQRMMRAYHQSTATINLLRAFTKGGYADLHRIHKWTLEFIKDTNIGNKFVDYADSIQKAIQFMEASGIQNDDHNLCTTDFYTSHECLNLWYEQSLTRQDSVTGEWVCGSGHFLWIGDRTRQLDSAHVEFLSGVINPLGLKCGPTLSSDELIRLIDKLNPENEPGRLTLITRFGADKIHDHLPQLIEAVHREGRYVVWSCDPMHGNTYKTGEGYKTRSFDTVLKEVKGFFEIHNEMGSFPGGIHLEMTARNVTECVGGSQNIQDEHLKDRYQTACDPRLNATQSIDLAFTLSDYISE